MKNHATSKMDAPNPPTAPAAIKALPSGSATKLADSDERTSESLARGILDSVVVGVVRFNKDRFVDYMNPYARQLLGPFAPLQGEEPALSNFAPFTIWPDESVCLVEDYPASRCFATGLPQGPTTLGLRRDGAPTTWITISGVPILDPATGKPDSVIATFVDATQHHEIERSLRQSEDRYRGLVEQTPDAILVQFDGKIVFINDAGVKLWGGETREALIGRRILDFIHPRYRELVERRMEQAKRGQITPLVDQLHVRPDGTRVRVEVTGIPCEYDGRPCVQVIMRDVTRRRRVERQVRRQRELLKKFFDRIPLVVVMFDAAGRIKMVNREWHRVLGWDSTARLSKILEWCFPEPRDCRMATEYIQAAPAGWSDSRVRARDGRTLTFSSAVFVLSDGARVGIGQDVTEKRAAERALRRHKRELEKRVKSRTEELVRKNEQLQDEIGVRRIAESELQEKQQTLEQALATHERYRQLLAYEIHDTFVQDVTAAVMFLDLFYDQQSESGDQSLEPVERARTLLRKSLAGARRTISGLRPLIIDEQGLVPGIEYLVSELNVNGMDVHLEHDVRVERFASVAEAALFRIVQEALTNVQRHSGSKFAQVSLTQGTDTLRLIVRDFGAGFDPAAVGKGHFGLRGIAERARLLSGTVNVHSAPGRGTEIIVEVPVTPGSPTMVSSADAGAADAAAADSDPAR